MNTLLSVKYWIAGLLFVLAMVMLPVAVEAQGPRQTTTPIGSNAYGYHYTSASHNGVGIGYTNGSSHWVVGIGYKSNGEPYFLYHSANAKNDYRFGDAMGIGSALENTFNRAQAR